MRICSLRCRMIYLHLISSHVTLNPSTDLKYVETETSNPQILNLTLAKAALTTNANLAQDRPAGSSVSKPKANAFDRYRDRMEKGGEDVMASQLSAETADVKLLEDVEMPYMMFVLTSFILSFC